MNTLGFCALSIALSGVTALSAAAGCSGAPDHTSTVTADTHVTSAPASVTTLTGTWGFALGESEVAAKVRAGCEAESGGDSAKSSACYEAVRVEASAEKIRFTPQPDGTTLWTSFGEKPGGEELFFEVPLELVAQGGGRLAGKVVGAPRGKQATEPSHAMEIGGAIPFELADDHTLVMPDPHKGRLVFHKE